MVDLYVDRRKREMYEDGVASALAFNDPEALKTLQESKPSSEVPDGSPGKVPGQWWKTTTYGDES